LPLPLFRSSADAHGAVSHTRHSELSALDLALGKGHTEMAELLRNYKVRRKHSAHGFSRHQRKGMFVVDACAALGPAEGGSLTLAHSDSCFAAAAAIDPIIARHQ